MPVKAISGDIRAVWGPARKGNRWQVVVQTVDGVRHCRTISRQAEAQTWADDQRARIAVYRVPIKAMPAWDGTAKWYLDGQAAALTAMHMCDNPLERETKRKESDSWAKACQAAPKLIDVTQFEKRIAALEATDKAEVAKKKHGPRAGKQNRPTRAAPRPGTPIR